MAEPTRQQLLDAFRWLDDGTDPQLVELHEAAAELADDPQLLESLQRSLQFDAALRQSLDEAPVPEDLAARLTLAVEQAADEQAAEDERRTEPAAAPKRSRRLWIGAAIATAAAAAAVALIVLQGGPPERLSGLQVAQLAEQLAEQWESEQDWSDTSAPASRPLDPNLRMGPLQWRRFSFLGDPDAVAYRSGHVMLLVCAASNVEEFGAAPPDPPQGDTGPYRIGVWQSDGLVYVLVVTGDIDRYRRVLVPGPFA